MIKSPNDFIPCSPYVSEGVTAEVTRGLAFVKQKSNLFALTVLQDVELVSGEITKGSKLYLRQEDLETQSWAKKPLKFNGVECILVSIKDVIFVERPVEVAMETKVNVPQKGAGKKWSKKLGDLGNKKPPKELIDALNSHESKTGE